MHKLKRAAAAFAAFVVTAAAAQTLTAVPSYAAVTNLVANPSVETVNPDNTTRPQSWTTNRWGTSTVKWEYLTTGFDGARSVKVTLSGYADGDAKWLPAFANVTDTNFTYSEKFASNVKTHIVYEAKNAAGTSTYDDVVVDLPASTSAKAITYPFTVPSGTVKLRVLHLLESNGWLQTDAFSLSANTTTPPTTNPVPNPSMETPNPSNANLPQSWEHGFWGTNTRAFSYVSGGAADGNRFGRVKISAYTDGDAKWMFAGQPLNRGSDYRATFKYRIDNLSKAHVVAHYIKDNGDEDFFGMPQPMVGSATTWNTYSDVFNVPADAKSVDVFMFIDGVATLDVDDFKIEPYTYTGFTSGIVSLTFDDVPMVNEHTQLPVLTQYGLKSTNYYDTKEGTDSSGWIEGNTTNQNLVKKYAAAGQEIGAHTITHPHLPTLTCPGTNLTDELTKPQTLLKSLSGQPVANFASPYGEYNGCVNGEIAKYYTSHRTTDEGFNSKDNLNLMRIRVQNMTPTTTLAQFQAWVNKAKADRTWLVLVYHNIMDPAVDGEPDLYDTYLSDFENQMAWLSASGAQVKTMTDAINTVKVQ